MENCQLKNKTTLINSYSFVGVYKEQFYELDISKVPVKYFPYTKPDSFRFVDAVRFLQDIKGYSILEDPSFTRTPSEQVLCLGKVITYNGKDFDRIECRSKSGKTHYGALYNDGSIYILP